MRPSGSNAPATLSPSRLAGAAYFGATSFWILGAALAIMR